MYAYPVPQRFFYVNDPNIQEYVRREIREEREKQKRWRQKNKRKKKKSKVKRKSKKDAKYEDEDEEEEEEEGIVTSVCKSARRNKGGIVLYILIFSVTLYLLYVFFWN